MNPRTSRRIWLVCLRHASQGWCRPMHRCWPRAADALPNQAPSDAHWPESACTTRRPGWSLAVAPQQGLDRLLFSYVFLGIGVARSGCLICRCLQGPRAEAYW